MPDPGRPEPGEYHEYYGRYIDLIPGSDVLGALEAGIGESSALLSSVPADLETFRYAEGKWSVREVVGHVLDTERVFAVRALAFARGDPAHLFSFEQDEWAVVSNAGERPLADLIAEFEVARAAHLAMFRGFDETAWRRSGIASEREFSVRSIPWIMAGHEAHHRKVLAERYLSR